MIQGISSKVSSVRGSVVKFVDIVIGWAKKPFLFLHNVQQKISGLAEATGLAWIFKKLSQIGKFLGKKQIVAALLRVSVIKLAKFRRALKKLVKWLKGKLGALPVVNKLVIMLEKVLDVILWVDDKLFTALEAVGSWIISNIMSLLGPIYSFLTGGDEDEDEDEDEKGCKNPTVTVAEVMP